MRSGFAAAPCWEPELELVLMLVDATGALPEDDARAPWDDEVATPSLVERLDADALDDMLLPDPNTLRPGVGVDFVVAKTLPTLVLAEELILLVLDELLCAEVRTVPFLEEETSAPVVGFTTKGATRAPVGFTPARGAVFLSAPESRAFIGGRLPGALAGGLAPGRRPR